jgi:hypothetical protein
MIILSINPNYRALVYKYHIQNTNDYTNWTLVNIHYYETEEPHENYDALKALTHHRSTWILEGLTDEIKDGKIKKEHFFETLSLIGENPAGRHLAWRFVRRYYDQIVKEYFFNFF